MILHSLYKKQNGSAAVEFAIIVPVLAALVFGIIEFSLFLFNKHVLTNACREGARSGIVCRVPRMSDEDIAAIVKSSCDDHLVIFDSGPVLVTPVINRTDPDNNPLGVDAYGNPKLGSFGDLLTVSVALEYKFLYLANLGIGPFSLDSSSTMRME